MNTLTLSLENNHPSEEFRFSVRRMVNAGYTARDQKKVMKHIEELKKEGIPVPESTPMAFQVISKLVYLDDEIEVVGEKTSGEAEYVLLCSDREIYVGVGSDHTDRELESVSILKSKQVCPNVMSRHVWRLRDIRKDWDAMVLRSWVRDGKGARILYQAGTLDTLMTPEELMVFVQSKLDDRNLEGVVIFSGTLPVLSGEMSYSDSFEVEIHNPKTKKTLSCAYRVNVLNYLGR